VTHRDFSLDPLGEHQPHLCNAANNVLFDYLSGAADQGGWESDSKRPGGLKIDDEFDPYGRSAGLAPLRIRPA
jgi:hypothetical protein